MKTLIAGLATIAAIALPSAAAQAREVPPFTFDANAYVRLRVIVDIASEVDEGVFDKRFCPDKSAFGLDLDALLSGDRTASLIMRVDAPQAEPVELNVFDIERKGGGVFSGAKCRLSLNRIDYKSPLYLASQFRDRTISTGPQFADQKGAAQLFSEGLTGFLAIANAIAPLPTPLLDAEDGLVSRVTTGLTRKTEISDSIALNIGPSGRHRETWDFTSSTRPGMPRLTINAFLENVGSYFTRPQGGWDPALLLATSFPPNPKVPASNFSAYLASLGTPFSDFVAANDLGGFNARCDTLRGVISSLGFSPMDRSLLLWAAARGSAGMRGDKAIDHGECMRTTFAELAQFEATRMITARPLDPPPVTALPAGEAQMRLTAESGERLAIFMLSPDLETARAAADELFAFPLPFDDQTGSGLMREPVLELQNADQWETRRTDRTRPLAGRVGCYLFLPASAEGQSRMLLFAAIEGQGGSRDMLVEMRFAAVPPGTERARIARMTLRDAAQAAGDIALMQSRFPRGCGLSGWRPALLD